MILAPTTSATAPKISKRQPAARAYTAAGQSTRASDNPPSRARRGVAAMRIPDPIVFRKLTPSSVTMTVMPRALDKDNDADGFRSTLAGFWEPRGGAAAAAGGAL